MPPPQTLRVEFSPEVKRALDKLTKAIQNIKFPAPDFTEVNRQFREAFPNMDEAPRLEESTEKWSRIIGDDECYLSADKRVISLDDQEYVKTCGEEVYSGSFGTAWIDRTFCWLPVDHHHDHEDSTGATREKD